MQRCKQSAQKVMARTISSASFSQSFCHLASLSVTSAALNKKYPVKKKEHFHDGVSLDVLFFFLGLVCPPYIDSGHMVYESPKTSHSLRREREEKKRTSPTSKTRRTDTLKLIHSIPIYRNATFRVLFFFRWLNKYFEFLV